MREAELDYVGVRSCGCASAWLSGAHASRSEVRDFELEMANTGREVRRMSTDAARRALAWPGHGCPHTTNTEEVQ